MGGNLDVSDPIRNIEAELMGSEPEPVEGGSNLSELIKTRVSIPTDKVTTTPPASANPSAPRRVEVPVTIQIDGTEREIELLLRITFEKK